jgi:hypothetical protein
MKKSTIIITVLGLLLLVLIFKYQSSISYETPIYIIAGNEEIKTNNLEIKAFESVFKEEGFPFKTISYSHILKKNPQKLGRKNIALIFPDEASQKLHDGFKLWSYEFVKAGGNIAVIYNSGVKNSGGAYLPKDLFSKITLVNSSTYAKYKAKTYIYGYFKFKDKASADFFEITPGKLDENLMLSGYSYGKLKYPIARVQAQKELKDEQIYAYAVSQKGENYPAITLNRLGKGNALFVNLPLGKVKMYSDDLPLRAIMRTFLLKIVKIPHLLNTPKGIGGIIINWHIDSSIEHDTLPWALRNGYFMNKLKYSIDITAGNFNDNPGDGNGFDACGKGKKIVRQIMPYGEIGSHGGWGHNWFAKNMEENKFSIEKIEKYIRMNNECLSSVTGRPIREYSAPVGIHPPSVTKILEEMKIKAYYYTGDTGSAPNRTFLSGKMVSDKVIAFPVTPFGKDASFYEMKKAKRTNKEMRAWLCSMADFAEKNRVIRLMYSHIYDVRNEYPKVVKDFLNHLIKKQDAGLLNINTMAYFADFIERFLKTSTEFKIKKDGISIELENKDSLENIVMALPLGKFNVPKDYISKDENYYYINLKDTKNEDFFFKYSNK